MGCSNHCRSSSTWVSDHVFTQPPPEFSLYHFICAVREIQYGTAEGIIIESVSLSPVLHFLFNCLSEHAAAHLNFQMFFFQLHNLIF